MFHSPYSSLCALSIGIPKIQFPTLPYLIGIRIGPIPLTLLRTLSPSLIEPITIIIHASLITSIVPKSMKPSYITPIIKKLPLTTRTCRAIDPSPSFHQSQDLGANCICSTYKLHHYQFNY